MGAGTAVAAAAGTTAAAAGTGPGTISNHHLARSLHGGFSSHYATVNGVRLHYVAGGHGEPLILLHGWPQTWWEFSKVMPALARHYRVIAVDLRGGGASDKPEGGYDKKTMARDIAELIRALGYDSAHVAGHDIGSIVGYSLAANHPERLRKLAMLAVTHPDESYYEFRMLPKPEDPFHLWWFAFTQVRELPEQLVEGRSRFLIDWMLDNAMQNPAAVTDFDRRVYAQAYDSRDTIRGTNGWYQAFGQDIADMATYAPVSTPILGMADGFFYTSMSQTLPQVAKDVTLKEVTGAGHYFIEEKPDMVADELIGFFG
ncbi:alpha/beta hydrolase [Saccharomonospora piscinae]|nr:alpha/beta hydrolase [Saccharomonospora piscinae]